MNKPSTIIYEEFKQKLTDLINNSGLPPFVVELVLCNYLDEIKIVVQKQYQSDKVLYEKSITETIKDIKDNDIDKT